MQPPQFELFGPAHIVVIALTAIVPVAMVRVVRRGQRRAQRRGESDRLARATCVALALVLAVNQITNWVVGFVVDGGVVFVREHLPLHLCGMSSILAVVVLLTRHRLSYELLYFWGLSGATNSVVTPELDAGWPSYEFVQYYVSHGGIVVAAVLATWGLGMRPTFRSLIRAFVLLNVLALVVGGVNLATGANYMYLSEKPVAASPFLLFDWPWYIVWLELVALAFFALFYLAAIVAGPAHAPAARPSTAAQGTQRSSR